MITKRFTWLKKDVYAPQIVITDSLTEKDLTPTDCYELLNELNEENMQLKRQNEYIIGQIKAFRDDCHTYQDFHGQSTLNRLLDILEEGKELFDDGDVE